MSFFILRSIRYKSDLIPPMIESHPSRPPLSFRPGFLEFWRECVFVPWVEAPLEALDPSREFIDRRRGCLVYDHSSSFPSLLSLSVALKRSRYRSSLDL